MVFVLLEHSGSPGRGHPSRCHQLLPELHCKDQTAKEEVCAHRHLSVALFSMGDIKLSSGCSASKWVISAWGAALPVWNRALSMLTKTSPQLEHRAWNTDQHFVSEGRKFSFEVRVFPCHVGNSGMRRAARAALCEVQTLKCACEAGQDTAHVAGNSAASPHTDSLACQALGSIGCSSDTC